MIGLMNTARKCRGALAFSTGVPIATNTSTIAQFTRSTVNEPKDDKNSLRVYRPDVASELFPSDSRRLAAGERLKQAIARGIPTLAFVDRPLPDDQLAVILLGQEQTGPSRYIVVERSSFTDDVLNRATGLAIQWQVEHPSDESATVITLYKDGRYDGQSAGHPSSGKQDYRRFGPQREIMSSEILTKAAATDPVDLPNFGAVRLVPLS
jgi:hypothetical protein